MKTYVIEMTKVIVIEIEAQDEAAAMSQLQDEDADDTHAQQWYDADPITKLLHVEGDFK